jgi:hypothetical protein
MEKCPSCAVELQSDSIRCQCGYEFGRSEATNTKKQSSTSKSTNYDSEKYPMLKLVAAGYKILAWLVIPIFLLSAYGTFKAIGSDGFYMVILYVLYAAGAFITLYAFSEGIHVFMDIEKNTRQR